MPASVRVALPRGYDVCIRQRCSASSGNCVRIAARTRIWPRRSKNRAFCIDESVLSGPIQESPSNNWIGRVCLPRSVLPVELSEIPRVVSFYAISPKSGLPDPIPGSGSRGGCLFASNGWDAAAKEFMTAVRVATGLLYAREARWWSTTPAARRGGREPVAEAAT